MHPCLNVDEILRFLACELVASGAQATAVSLACCCKCFEDPVLDALWERQDRLTPLLKCLPQDTWDEKGGTFSFERIPTEAEWTDFQKHARRMRNLTVDTFGDPVTSQVLLPLQRHAANKPLLPRLKAFVCEEATEAFIPFIPSFLSPRTVNVTIMFSRGSSTTVVASLTSKLSTLCPDLEYIVLGRLLRDSVTIDAVSEMVLSCNRNSLQMFEVDSPLTEEAREVVYQLPRLISLCTIVEGPTSLPTVLLPELIGLAIIYEDDLDWLRGFREGRLEKLRSIMIGSNSNRIGDFLGAFESVALATSIQNTLSIFVFHTTSSWDPNYRYLLSFKQLEELDIGFSCYGGCSSKVDDNIIISLAQAMPKLEILRLGGAPCKTPAGVTVNGLIGLACRCSHLSKLRVHFHATSLVDAAATALTRSPSDEPVVQRGNYALRDLEVGQIPIPEGSASTVASVLLQIFPHIWNVTYTNREWKTVAEAIRDSRWVGASARRSGMAHPSHLQPSSVTQYQETQSQ